MQCGSGEGCRQVTNWAPAGYCYDDVVATLSSAAPRAAHTSLENTAYVNGYVKDCKGQYVAVRMAIERQTT